MTELSRVLGDFCGLFEGMGIRYAVMGGIAVRVYGIPRPTYDIDFTVALDRSRLPEFYRAVGNLGYTVPEPYLQGWIDRVADLPLVKARLYLADQGIDVDLFLAESPYQEELLRRRRREPVADSQVWLVSPEDLILLKLLAKRQRDFADIGDVLFTQGQLDEAYLRRWAKPLGILPELEQVLTRPPQI